MADVIPIREILGAAVGGVIVLLTLTTYDRLIDDPAVRQAATEKMVERTLAEAAFAKADELTRQLQAAEKVSNNLEQQLSIARKVAAERTEKLEKEAKDYEALLARDGKRRPLDQRDIDWLRRPR